MYREAFLAVSSAGHLSACPFCHVAPGRPSWWSQVGPKSVILGFVAQRWANHVCPIAPNCPHGLWNRGTGGGADSAGDNFGKGPFRYPCKSKSLKGLRSLCGDQQWGQGSAAAFWRPLLGAIGARLANGGQAFQDQGIGGGGGARLKEYAAWHLRMHVHEGGIRHAGKWEGGELTTRCGGWVAGGGKAEGACRLAPPCARACAPFEGGIRHAGEWGGAVAHALWGVGGGGRGGGIIVTKSQRQEHPTQTPGLPHTSLTPRRASNVAESAHGHAWLLPRCASLCFVVVMCFVVIRHCASQLTPSGDGPGDGVAYRRGSLCPGRDRRRPSHPPGHHGRGVSGDGVGRGPG